MMTHRRLRVLLSRGGLLTLALLAAPAPAQERVSVLSEPGTPVVALQVLVATGPADEPVEKAGLAYLSARAVTAPIVATLDSLGAHLAVAAHKDATAFTLTAAPDVWREASRTLLVALFRDPPTGAVVAREKGAIQAELAARKGNPADAVLREGDAALHGPDHPWGRPTVGTAETVGALAVEDVDRFLRARFTADRAVAAVVGPVDPEQAREHLGAFLGATGRISAPVEAPRAGPSPVRRDYSSVSTWVLVSYRIPPTADLEAVRFLAQLAADELSFSPSRQSVLNARSEVIPRLGGGEIRFQLVTPPAEADRWAERILQVVREVAHRPMLEDLFEARLRRYRGERLYALAAPEARAEEIAREMLVVGRSDGLISELDGMTVERLRAAVRTLSAPTVVFLGPFLDHAG